MNIAQNDSLNFQDVHFACHALSTAFANAVDHREYERLLELFCEDGVFERWDTSFHGREDISAMLEARPETIQTRHMCTNFELQQHVQDTATGITYFLFFRIEGKDSELLPLASPAMVGEYHDEYRLTDGGWRIARRKVRKVFVDVP